MAAYSHALHQAQMHHISLHNIFIVIFNLYFSTIACKADTRLHPALTGVVHIIIVIVYIILSGAVEMTVGGVV